MASSFSPPREANFRAGRVKAIGSAPATRAPDFRAGRPPTRTLPAPTAMAASALLAAKPRRTISTSSRRLTDRRTFMHRKNVTITALLGAASVSIAIGLGAMAMDMVWHGLSSKPPFRGEAVPVYGDQVLDLMDTLGIERAHIEGEAIGIMPGALASIWPGKALETIFIKWGDAGRQPPGSPESGRIDRKPGRWRVHFRP